MDPAAAIIARLGLDKAGFTRDFNAAAQEAEAAGNRLQRGMGGAEGAQDRLLTSSHRVARQIQNTTRDMLSGADASHVFSGALEGLERSLRLPLGALAGLAIAGVAAQQIGQVIAKYEALNQEIDKIIEPRGDLSGLSLKAVTEHADSAEKAIKKLDESNSGFWNRVQKTFLSVTFSSIPGKSRPLEQIETEKRSGLVAARAEDIHYEAGRQDRLNAINAANIPESLKQAQRLQIEFTDKIYEATQRGGQILAKPLIDALNIDLRHIAEKISQARLERVQATLGEIAGRPDTAALLNEKHSSQNEVDQARQELVNVRSRGGNVSQAQIKVDEAEQRYSDASKALAAAFNTFSPTALYEGEQARSVQRDESAAGRARDTIGGKAGLDEAQRIISRSDETRLGIESLKENEKDLTGAFRGAIDSATIFREMVAAIKGISFANQ